MKILKIEANKGKFTYDGVSYHDIDGITKADILKMLDVFVQEDCEMDVFSESLIPNPAQQIIYKSLYDRFNDLESSKSQFNDAKDSTFAEAKAKYKMEN